MVGTLAMIEISTSILLCALLAVPIGWALPRSLALDGVAIWTALVMIWLAPLSAAWLIGMAWLTPVLLQLGERTGWRNVIAAALVVMLLAGFSAARLPSGVLLVGVAFFTLRHLHVVGDWWMAKLPAPRLREHLRYQLFLPVTVAGPIHRFQNFTRQVERRRWDAPDFLTGLERVLIGSFMAYVVGSWFIARGGIELDARLGGANPFVRDWAKSAVDWVRLYFVFAGMVSIALGTSLMLGLKLEENFNRPWHATSLLDFWRRWHMTLSSWVQDYVFQPVLALTRNPLLGLVAAMLAIGLWHEYSAYYVLWSFWQVLGIVLTRIAAKYLREFGPHRLVRHFVMPASVLVWLSLSRPVVERLLELAP
jgi:alginate O-acetyltransferase complex protein AlgI